MDPLKQLLTDKKERIKEAKAEIKELKKENTSKSNQINKLTNEITELEGLVKRFSPTRMQPVQIGDIVINYKLYTQFIKKLKGFFITEEITQDKLILKYYKGITKGELQLHDLTHIFPSGSEFPEGKLQESAAL